MPQMTFWARQIPSGVRWEYRMDPHEPGDDGTFYVTVVDQSDRPMKAAGCRVPIAALHECVGSLIETSWEVYLFGELDDLQPMLSAQLNRWRQYLAGNRRQGEVPGTSQR